MPRRLRTFVTTSGFFELAVAAPSMKAALELWGAGPDVFRRGYAKETTDAAVVAATLKKPGVVLQRGVGSTGAFKEHAELPDISALDKGAPKSKPRAKPVAKPAPAPAPAPKPVDKAAEKEALQRYEQAQKQREREKARAEAEARKARERLERQIGQAERAIAAAQAKHDARIGAIEEKLAELESEARKEDERWKQEKQRLDEALRRIRG